MNRYTLRLKGSILGCVFADSVRTMHNLDPFSKNTCSVFEINGMPDVYLWNEPDISRELE